MILGRVCVCVFVGGPSSHNIICGKVEIECRLKMKKHIELFSDSGKSREHKC